MWLPSLLACVEAPVVPLDTVPEDDTAAIVTTATSECVADTPRSACQNKASIVQAMVSVPDGAPTTGDLVVVMLHRRMGDPANGGHPHWAWTFPDVDLSEPLPIDVDMCDGNAAMWSEENCEYNLVIVLDQNGDNGLTGSAFATPGVGEPATLVDFELSCHADGPLCLGEVELGCTDGAACITYEPPGDCACAAETCESESAICAL